MTEWGREWPRDATPDSVPLILGRVDRDRAIIAMLSTGAFTDSPALARWAVTAEAQPILRGFLLDRIKPDPSEFFAVDFEACEAEIAAQDLLAADIEARFE